MTLRLYYHPFSSFCQKALIALYEHDLPFERQIVDLGDPADRAALAALWPFAKFPLLRDEARGVTLPESSVIVEYVDRLAGAGSARLVPDDPDAALAVRLWDRLFDLYVDVPLQTIVIDALRGAGGNAAGVADARTTLATAYRVIEAELARHRGDWATGAAFTMADCAAAPALLYANIAVPFAGHQRLAGYFERLLARPSFARAVEEARPFRHYFPLGWPEGYPGTGPASNARSS